MDISGGDFVPGTPITGPLNVRGDIIATGIIKSAQIPTTFPVPSTDSNRLSATRAINNGVSNSLVLELLSSIGPVVAGFGNQIGMKLQHATGGTVAAAALSYAWLDPNFPTTAAARMILSAMSAGVMTDMLILDGAALRVILPFNLSVRGLQYNWPVAHAVGKLTNDGAGNLTWAP